MDHPHSLEQLIYVLPKPMDDELICTICHNPLLDPMVKPSCRQMFCQNCLAAWLGGLVPARTATKLLPSQKSFPRPVSSPISSTLSTWFVRRVMDISNAISLSLMERSVSSVRAPLNEWDFSLLTLVPACKLGCGRLIAPIDVITHSEVCPAKMLACPTADVGCETTAARSKLEEHTKHCPLLPMHPLLQRLQALENSSWIQAQVFPFLFLSPHFAHMLTLTQ